MQNFFIGCSKVNTVISNTVAFKERAGHVVTSKCSDYLVRGMNERQVQDRRVCLFVKQNSIVYPGGVQHTISVDRDTVNGRLYVTTPYC